jgi:hypothetical protein
LISKNPYQQSIDDKELIVEGSLANPTVMVIQQWSKQSFHPHHPGVFSDTPPWIFFFYWENAKFQCKKKGLFTQIMT